VTNCFLWACRKWRKHGGYLVIRKSRYGWWWHFLWMPADRSEIESYVPDNPKHKTLPPPVFKGSVKKGD
jgi:hypothetical protein